MKIVADENIPAVAEAFADLGEVERLPGREIHARHLRDCRCLLVRTVTRVDADLLRDSKVEFVASATVGTDHVDLQYLKDRGIGFSNAAGSNAEAAAEYVVAGLFALSERGGFDPFTSRVGIIGLGNIGGRLYQILSTLGIQCLTCDPPLAAAGRNDPEFVDLDTLLRECNVVSLHVPLTTTGEHPTFHLLDAARLAALKPDCLLINAARGEVVDNRALASLLERRRDLQVFLDTWEHEPRIATELLDRVDLATPHVAGYSVEGRLRATQMILDAACMHFGCESGWQMSMHLPAARGLTPPDADSKSEFWQALFRAHYDIWRDHEHLVAAVNMDDAKRASHFDALRKSYPQRFEYGSRIIGDAVDRQRADLLAQLGFRLDSGN